MAVGTVDRSSGEKAEQFKKLAVPHLDAVYTLARYLMRSANDADDAVQECYLRAFRHFDTFHGGSIKPWLMAILRNSCRDIYVGNTSLVYSSENDGEDTDAPSANPMWREDSETPEQVVLRRQDSETMRRLIHELPTEFREAIVLREINDLPYRDIATIVEVPIGTVMSRLARARVMLRDAWLAFESGSESR